MRNDSQKQFAVAGKLSNFLGVAEVAEIPPMSATRARARERVNLKTPPLAATCHRERFIFETIGDTNRIRLALKALRRQYGIKVRWPDQTTLLAFDDALRAGAGPLISASSAPESAPKLGSQIATRVHSKGCKRGSNHARTISPSKRPFESTQPIADKRLTIGLCDRMAEKSPMVADTSPVPASPTTILESMPQ